MHTPPIHPGIAAITPAMIELRRAIHAEPELGFEEFATRGKVIQHLREWGYELHLDLAGTAVVATLRNGEGPTLGLRGVPLQQDRPLAEPSPAGDVAGGPAAVAEVHPGA